MYTHQKEPTRFSEVLRPNRGQTGASGSGEHVYPPVVHDRLAPTEHLASTIAPEKPTC